MARPAATKCRVCDYTYQIFKGRCVPCTREYDAEQKRKRVSRRRSEMGDIAYREHQRSLRKGRKRGYVKRVPTVKAAKVVQPYVRVRPEPEPVTPVLTVGRRIPGASASIHERLACPEWMAHYTREGMLEAMLREAGR